MKMVEATYGLQPNCLPNARCGRVPNGRWVARHMQPLLANRDVCKFCGIKGHHSQLILAILQKFCDVKWEAIISATKMSLMRSLSTAREASQKMLPKHCVRMASEHIQELGSQGDQGSHKRISRIRRQKIVGPLDNFGRAFCPAQKEAENDVASIL